MDIEFAGNHFTLYPNRTLIWHEQNALLLSDIHLGKSTHFRKHGMALPDYYAKKDLQDLENLFTHTSAETIVILGDLFHAEYNAEWDLWVALRNKVAYKKMILICGNHDILPLSHFIENNILVLHTWKANGITLIHDKEESDSFTISGHLHPGFLISDQKLTHLKLPCFFMKESNLTLPAFGSTTGNVAINNLKPDAVWLCAGDKVLKVN